MRRKRKIEEGASQSGTQALFVSLSVILLSFFIVLSTISTRDERKLRQGIGSFLGNFGILPGGTSALKGDELLLKGAPITPSSASSKSGQIAVQRLAKYIDLENLQDEVSIKTERGTSVTITISEKILFPPAESQISPSALPLLERVRGLVRLTTNDVVVEGHTDNASINRERYSSNWELSGARAVSVVEYLLKDEQISRERLAAAGYGEFKPLVDREPSDAGASNRRVSIVFLDKVRKVESQRWRDLVAIKGFRFKFKSYVWKQES